MNSGLTATSNTTSPAMGYLEYLKLNPDYEATAAAADTLRRASEPAVPGCGYPHFASMTLRV
jgi:hypothetical protein